MNRFHTEVHIKLLTELFKMIYPQFFIKISDNAAVWVWGNGWLVYTEVTGVIDVENVLVSSRADATRISICHVEYVRRLFIACCELIGPPKLSINSIYVLNVYKLFNICSVSEITWYDLDSTISSSYCRCAVKHSC